MVVRTENRGESENNGFSASRELIASFLLLFVPASLLLALIFYAFSYQTQEYELQTILLHEELALNDASALTSLLFEQKLSDLMVLAEGGVIRSYLHDRSLKNWTHLAREFSLLARRKPKYFQVRFIDDEGKEVVRINNSDSGQAIVPPGEMQDKGDRYYFKEAIKLKAGDIYLSPLDLNVERGQIEQPIKPTIRLATPAIDGYGKKQGIVIINYTPDELLQGVAGNFKALQGDAMMLNSQGYWLQGGPQGLQWGFMFGKDDTFAKRKPDVWSAVLKNEAGTYFSDDGVYIFQKAYPLDKDNMGTVENFDATTFAAVDSGKERRYWIYLSHISNEMIKELTAKLLLIAAGTYLLLFLLVGVISAMFAKNSVQKKIAFRKLQQYATTDDLTGLANRRELDKVALREFKRALRFSRHLTVLMLDLDNFKAVNDTYGHNVGDDVLRHVTGICANAIRGQDFIARYGGEEFTFLLPETDLESGSKLGQRICDEIAATPFQSTQHTITQTVSVGVSEIEKGDEVFEDLIYRADKALYEAKKRGRNQVVCSTGDGFYSHHVMVNA
jgi:diguanylate cyclase (GGDEF)-like protein